MEREVEFLLISVCSKCTSAELLLTVLAAQ